MSKQSPADGFVNTYQAGLKANNFKFTGHSTQEELDIATNLLNPIVQNMVRLECRYHFTPSHLVLVVPGSQRATAAPQRRTGH